MDILIKSIDAGDKNYNRLVEFLDAANFDWSVQPVLQQADVSSSAKVDECNHPDWAMSKHGSTEMCNKCGKMWG